LGYETFASDRAHDMLAVWINKIIDHIRDTFTLDSEDRPYDGYGDAHIVANVDILITLCEHYNFFPDLESKEISKWKRDYLNTYDRFMSRFTRPIDIDELTQRRAVIATTFDRFQKIVNELHEEESE
jgi:hypothetical protein